MIAWALANPDMYIVEVEAGRSPPIPWYVEYVRRAEQWGCPPWELLDSPTPKLFWLKAAAIVAHADRLAHERTRGTASH